jgi:hypothetical protein
MALLTYAIPLHGKITTGKINSLYRVLKVLLGVFLPVDLLAAAAGLGGARDLADDLAVFVAELNPRQQLKRRESFMDGSLAPDGRGGTAVGKTKRGKGTKSVGRSTAAVTNKRLADPERLDANFWKSP